MDHIVLSAEGTYSFQYSDTDLTFPPLNTYAVDWYGYYNNTVSKNNFMPTREGARSGNGYLETMRKPNYETTKYGILTAIKYPTGGTSRFEYEQNTYSNDLTKYYTSPGNRVAAGLRIAQITNYDADNTEILRRSFSYINEMVRHRGNSFGVRSYIPNINLFHRDLIKSTGKRYRLPAISHTLPGRISNIYALLKNNLSQLKVIVNH